MRIKTIIIVFITILLTVVLMQNTGRANFNVLWMTVSTSKLAMLVLFAFIGFVLGLLAGRPKRVIKLGNDIVDDSAVKKDFNTLSDEDRDYIK